MARSCRWRCSSLSVSLPRRVLRRSLFCCVRDRCTGSLRVGHRRRAGDFERTGGGSRQEIELGRTWRRALELCACRCPAAACGSRGKAALAGRPAGILRLGVEHGQLAGAAVAGAERRELDDGKGEGGSEGSELGAALPPFARPRFIVRHKRRAHDRPFCVLGSCQQFIPRLFIR